MNDQPAPPAALPPQLSLVIPARNEAENIPLLAQEIRAALDGRFSHEILFVDDGSSDSSWEILGRLAKESGGTLRAIRHEASVGQSLAILSGAWAAQGEWLVTLDGDGQNDPADIPGMFAALLGARDGDPRVVGVMGHRVTRRDDFVKRVSSRLANGFRDLLLRDGIPDIGCGLKILRREWYLRIPGFSHMHRYIPVLVQARGGIMTVHPVNHRPRVRGVSKYGVWNRLWVGLVDVVGVWWLKRRLSAVRIRETL